jgi:ANTAR domain-containing protein/GAF domain-containing protein
MCSSSCCSSLTASARCVSSSANTFVVGFSVVLATSRNLLPADTAQCAALLMDGDGSGQRRQPGRGWTRQASRHVAVGYGVIWRSGAAIQFSQSPSSGKKPSVATDERLNESIRSAMLALSQNYITASEDVAATFGRVTESAVDLIDGVDYADVMLIQDGQHWSVAATDPVVTHLDELQMEFKEGPCLQAAVEDALIRCSDLQHDERWPTFAGAALAAGIRSVLSFQLYTNRGGAGALNLLSREPNTVDSEGEVIGAMLATHAAGLMVMVNRRKEFDSALASRDLIGQAKGILMHKFSIDSVRAFELMVRQSQNSNTPVRTIAQQIIDAYTRR